MPAKKKKRDDEKTKDTSPTVFTAAGLLAFSEEDAIIKIKPVHVVTASVVFILAVLVASLL